MARFSYLLVFLSALALRLSMPLSGGGLVGNYSYDAGVYYSAGAALVHGRMPYRDFVLLHPPGIALAVAPAAWVGRFTSASVGFAIAVLEFSVLGALSAVLVVVVARAVGAGTRMATIGGLFYAAWFVSVRAEYLNRLEPLGNFLVLCGLVAYVRTEGRHGNRWALVSGVALGAATAVKIWYAVPLVVVLCFLGARRGLRAAGWASLGATGALGMICGPFFALAPSSMWRMVVSEQVARDQSNPLRALVSLQRLPAGISWPTAYLLDAVVLVVAGVLLVAARRAPAVRLPAALLFTSSVVLFAAPSWFLFYGDYLAPAAALCVATVPLALGPTWRQTGPLLTRSCAIAGATIVALVVVGSAEAMWYRPATAATALPARQLASAVSSVACVSSDSPMALIGLNALDRDLSNGCVDWVDVTGRAYASDMIVRGQDGRQVPRVANPRWQKALGSYLRSGEAVIIIRSKDSGISPTTLDAIQGGGILAASGTDVVYAVHDSGSAAGGHHPPGSSAAAPADQRPRD